MNETDRRTRDSLTNDTSDPIRVHGSRHSATLTFQFILGPARPAKEVIDDGEFGLEAKEGAGQSRDLSLIAWPSGRAVGDQSQENGNSIDIRLELAWTLADGHGRPPIVAGRRLTGYES